MTVTAIGTAAHYQPAGRSRAIRPSVSASRTVAERRRSEALARLSSRVMPLPGQPMHIERQTVRRSCTAPVTDPALPELPRPMLTDREVEVLRTWLMVDSKPACGQTLHISLGTVNTHLTRIRAKYADIGRAASTKAALVARAIQDDIVDIEEL
ncbi:LuxR C-terminal-related transcriptional regulator [Gordonia zhaorongruii]|uniref:LuxR C-terminal-related transcriptional regulator n=1 Tax=Gordonia zhaorongruii TaxID=2597659 RepID=UPI00105030B7|nr:LuxR C-terminal-related transcriptional regulator [Gordonia zhaorongruii]